MPRIIEKKFKSGVSEAIHKMAESLNKAGYMNDVTLKNIDDRLMANTPCRDKYDKTKEAKNV